LVDRIKTQPKIYAEDNSEASYALAYA